MNYLKHSKIHCELSYYQKESHIFSPAFNRNGLRGQVKEEANEFEVHRIVDAAAEGLPSDQPPELTLLGST